MYGIQLESGRLGLASPDDCATWTGEARKLFRMGARSWRSVLEDPVRAMQHFHQLTSADVTLFVAAHPWTNADGMPTTLVSLYFGTDAAVNRDQLEALGKPLGGTEWSHDGIHAAPDYAFPCMALSDGALYHLWSENEKHGAVTQLLSARAGRAKSSVMTKDNAEHSRFFPQARHVIGTFDVPMDGDRQLKEQLKIAFSYRVAERVIEADGRVDDDERAFLMKTFPPEILEELWLDDMALRDLLADRAETELRDMLGYHEKIGLLSTFFAACYADGSVVVQELKVLKEASAALGLDRTEVVTYLHKRW